MTTITSAADVYASLNPTASSSQSAAATQADSTDRFLKMLVAQMQNQDPLNPMDNAQVTSQMAQINTVSGLEQVNMSVQSLNTQLLQMQMLQGASLVNREVTLAGDKLSIEDGKGRGGFGIASTASAVKVEVLNSEGKLVDTIQLGPQDAGQHSFEWDAGSTTNAQGYKFKVTATNKNEAVDSIALQYDRVQSVSTNSDGLSLTLRNSGVVAMTDVLSFN